MNTPLELVAIIERHGAYSREGLAADKALGKIIAQKRARQ